MTIPLPGPRTPVAAIADIFAREHERTYGHRADGDPVRPATVNMYVAAVKSFLGFAHRVGVTRFNAAPLIKLKKAPRQIAQRILGELEVRDLIKHAKPGRDRLMLQEDADLYLEKARNEARVNP